MRWKIPAGALVALAFLIPAAPAAAQTAAPRRRYSTTRRSRLAYLNNGLYEARALDCASQPTPTPTPSRPTPTPTATPSATSTVVPPVTPSASLGAPGGGEGGGLPVTGTDIATVAGVGGALLLLGGASYVIGRRRRSRFVA